MFGKRTGRALCHVRFSILSSRIRSVELEMHMVSHTLQAVTFAALVLGPFSRVGAQSPSSRLLESMAGGERGAAGVFRAAAQERSNERAPVFTDRSELPREVPRELPREIPRDLPPELPRGDGREPVTATPEPATMALVATGLASLAGWKRKRSKQATSASD